MNWSNSLISLMIKKKSILLNKGVKKLIKIEKLKNLNNKKNIVIEQHKLYVKESVKLQNTLMIGFVFRVACQQIIIQNKQQALL